MMHFPFLFNKNKLYIFATQKHTKIYRYFLTLEVNARDTVGAQPKLTSLVASCLALTQFVLNSKPGVSRGALRTEGGLA